MNETSQFGVASIILGVVSIFWPSAGFGIFLAIIGLVAGNTSYENATSKNEDASISIIGLVISGIALIINIIYIW